MPASTVSFRSRSYPVITDAGDSKPVVGRFVGVGSPTLVHDNHQTEPPAFPGEGYPLTENLAQRAIESMGDAKTAAANSFAGRAHRRARGVPWPPEATSYPGNGDAYGISALTRIESYGFIAPCHRTSADRSSGKPTFSAETRPHFLFGWS